MTAPGILLSPQTRVHHRLRIGNPDALRAQKSYCLQVLSCPYAAKTTLANNMSHIGNQRGKRTIILRIRTRGKNCRALSGFPRIAPSRRDSVPIARMVIVNHLRHQGFLCFLSIKAPERLSVIEGYSVVDNADPHLTLSLPQKDKSIISSMLHHRSETSTHVRARKPGSRIPLRTNCHHFRTAATRGGWRARNRGRCQSAHVLWVSRVGDSFILAIIPEQRGSHSVTADPFFILRRRDGFVRFLVEVQDQDLARKSICHLFSPTLISSQSCLHYQDCR